MDDFFPPADSPAPSIAPANSKLPASLLDRSAIYYVGVVLPCLCALVANLGPPDSPTWQDGTVASRLAFTLEAKNGWPLLLFLILPTFSLGKWFWNPSRPPSWMIRFGIASGIPVSLVYCFLVPMMLRTSFPIYMIVSFVIGLVLFFIPGAVRFIWHSGYAKYAGWAIAIGLTIVILLAMGGVGENVLGTIAISPAILVVISMVCGPVWALVVYSFCTCRLMVQQDVRGRFTLLTIISIVTWIATFMAAIRQSIMNSFAHYSTLPLEQPPQCYIATAAARGHPSIVGSIHGMTPDGENIWVNRQLEIFKAAELVIQCLFPKIHRAFRFVYDRVGPVGARCLGSPWLADVAFVLLKPMEWIALGILLILIGRDEARRVSLYQNRLGR